MIGTRLNGRYELLDELGRGGMALVYRARDPRLERDVAVKMISSEGLDDTAVERFQREAQVVAGLDHPAIAPIFDFGRHEGWLFFVMPVLRGDTLHGLLQERVLSLPDLLEIVAQVAEALDYSSSVGVVHRDIKPDNIMIALARPVDGQATIERVWVMDFGLALAGTASRLTKTGNLPGTLSYLSPEQVLSIDVDGRSDLYSLGTILYECLVGRPPFSGSPASVLYRIVHEIPADLEKWQVDPQLADLARRCLTKRPEDRLSCGSELAMALRSYLRLARTDDDLPAVAGAAAKASQVGPMVGRSKELRALRSSLDAAILGECQLALVGGDPGTGKTRLLQELEAETRGRGVETVRGRFSDRESAYPYQAFCEAIQDFLRKSASSSAGRHGSLPLDDLAPDLLLIFPALAELPAFGATPLQPSSANLKNPNDVYELICRTLARLAAGEPLVMLLENLHATDASVALLKYLLRRLASTPILVIGTYRTTELSRQHPLAKMMQDLHGDSRCWQIELQPLERDDHRQLIAGLVGEGNVGDDLAEQLYEATEGNPFFTEELVRDLLESGDITLDEEGTHSLAVERDLAGGLPETIQQAVETRLERLEDVQQSLLATASVLGKQFHYRDLRALWDGDRDELDDLIDQLHGRRLLVEERFSRGDRLRFASALVRDVVYGRLPRRRRRRLHRRHAERLEERYADRLERISSQLLHHFAEGDVPSKTVRYGLELARRFLDAYSWEDAIRAAGVALEFIDDDEPDIAPGAEGELRTILAKARRSAGAAEPAMKEAERAVRAFERVGEIEQAAEAAWILADTAWKARRIDRGRRWLERGLELARQSEAGETLVRLLRLSATVANLQGDHGRAGLLMRELESVSADLQPPDEALVRTGGTLRAGLMQGITDLDPAACFSVQDVEVQGAVFETLLLPSAADGMERPQLCQRWQAEGDRSFLFELATDRTFSDGTEVDARRVKDSFERAALVDVGYGRVAFSAIAGYEEFCAGKEEELTGIEVVRPDALRITLNQPLAIYPSLLTSLQTAVTLLRDGEVLGTGPFEVQEFGSQRIALVPNGNAQKHHELLIDRLEFRFFEESKQISAALHQGTVDIAHDLAPSHIEGFLRNPLFRRCVLESDQKNLFMLIFNPQGPRCSDPDLRRLLSGVIDNRELVWRSLGRFASPAISWLPPGILGHDPQRRKPMVDRFEAIEQMQQFTPLPVRLRALVHPQFADPYRSLAEALFSEWSLFGIEVEVELFSIESFREELQQRQDFDLVLSRWLPDYADPDAFAHGLLASDTGMYGNLLGSPEFDELIGAARQQNDPRQREQLYRQIEDVLARRNLLLPLFHDVVYRVASPRLRGIELLDRPPFVDYQRIGILSDDEARKRIHRDARPGRIRIPLQGSFESLDPRLGFMVEAANVLSNVFETLTRLDDGANVVPHLAEELLAADDGRRFRIRLQHVRFHDGRELTARDVRYSMERLLRELRLERDSVALPVVGLEAFRRGDAEHLEGIEVLDERELTIQLDYPVAHLPAILSHPTMAIVPAGCSRFDTTWRDGCAGTGPFCLVDFEAGERVELVANPSYWRPSLPRCESLVFEFDVPPEQVVNDFESGRMRIAPNLDRGELERLLRHSQYAAGLREHPAFSTFFLTFNRSRGPLSDEPTRRALFECLSSVRRKMRPLLGRIGVVAASLIPPGLIGHEANRYPESQSAMPVNLRGSTLRAAVHPLLLSRYGDVWLHLLRALDHEGINIEVTHSTTADMVSAAASGDVDLVACRWSASYPDGETYAGAFHSSGGLLGRMAGHPEIDELVGQARGMVEPAPRHDLYRRFEQLLVRDAVAVPLFHEQVCVLARPEVEGLRLRYGWPEISFEELHLRR